MDLLIRHGSELKTKIWHKHSFTSSLKDTIVFDKLRFKGNVGTSPKFFQLHIVARVDPELSLACSF
jgi:hypothetical protein